MGLAINIAFKADMKQNDAEGYQWAKEMFATTNRFLESEGEGTWTEPEVCNPTTRPYVGSFPYSFLHYLRRAYSYACEFPDTKKAPSGELSSRDESIIDDASSMMSSHLLCHSDAEGLYVPVNFEDPLFDTDEMGVPGGGMLGSSQGLLKELREVAAFLEIELTEAGLPDHEAKRLYDISCEDGHEYFREYCVFLALWEAANASVKHNTAIVFS